jgi:16S rRNA (guanine(1405)-N(7))-methyltransferase
MSGKARPVMSEATVGQMVERLSAAPKYRDIHIDTITDIVGHELPYAASDADLERRARLKLHRVMAGYLLSAQTSRLLRGLDEAVAGGPETLRGWCTAALSCHASTAERLPDLDRLYPAILGLTGPARSIADLACTLNPFTIPWLRATTTAAYTGYDLNLAYVELGTRFLELADPGSVVRHQDVLVRSEQVHGDVTLLLKTYHCMENRRPGAALRLVEELSSACVVVSFPTRTMSGRAAHFARAHIARLTELAERRGWELRTASLAAEEMVAVVKGAAAGEAVVSCAGAGVDGPRG